MNLKGSQGIVHLPREGGGVNGHVVPRCYAGVPRRVTATTWTATQEEITCGNCIDARAADTLRSLKKAPVTDAQRRTARSAKITRATSTRQAVTKPGATKPKKNGVAEDQAARKAEKIVQDLIAGIVAKRGTDDVGEGDQWADQRLEGCDDYTYDLAVEVRKARGAGTAWWRIAYDLGLPHAGPSAVQGKGGAAYARRLWKRAWGDTYETGERAARETKDDRRARAALTEVRPFFTEETLESEIVTKICGQEIHWVAQVKTPNGVIFSPQSAIVHHDPRTVRVVLGPKGRAVEFFEQIDAAQLKVDPRMAIAKTGPRRSVYVHNIEKVGA